MNTNTNQGRLGHYELQQLPESNSIRETWKGFDTQHKRTVVINILRFKTQNTPDSLLHFQKEMQIIASLQHPAIVPVLDFQVSSASNPMQSEAYIVLDYIEGPSLADYIQTSYKGNFLPGQEVISILTPIASALDYAHQRGIIHGNVKATNILLDKPDTATMPISKPRLTGFGLQLGRLPLALSLNDAYYVSPEVAQGQAPGERSDLYSLGVILYEMCTGKLPFHGDTPNDILTQHINAIAPTPSRINPLIPAAVTSVIMRSIAKDPAIRFSNANAMIVALEKAFNIPVLTAASANNTPVLDSTVLDETNVPTMRVSNTPSAYSDKQIVIAGPSAVQQYIQVPPVPSFSNKRPRRRKGYILLAALLILTVLGSSLAVFWYTHQGSS